WRVHGLDARIVPDLWREVTRRNRAWRRWWWQANSGEVRIRFRDGLVATLAANSVSSVNYDDTSRSNRNPLVIDNLELYGLVLRAVSAAKDDPAATSAKAP